MVMQMIKVHDLQMGDEVVMSVNSRLRYIRIEAPIKIVDAKKTWDLRPYCKSVKCSFHQEIKEYDGWKTHIDAYDPEKHNMVKYFNLNYRDLWLVKRNGEKL